MLPVDILIDGRRIGCVYFAHDGLLTETVSRPSTSTAPLTPRRECKHAAIAEGFAYIEFYDEHWPIRMCRDCRSLVAGRDPHPDRPERRAWFGPDDVIAARWAKYWPKPGRPRRKKPPASTEWPKAA
jgi:hypothetical protein